MPTKKQKCYNYKNSPPEIKLAIKEIIESLKNILQDNLVGVYLHGSLAMGCFNPEYSDIDFLIVAGNKLDFETKRNIIDSIIRISKSKKLPKKEVEFTIILKKYLDNFEYPTPFELHYSITHKEKYFNDPLYICGDKKDQDLAAHMTIVYVRGICLYGKPINEIFKPIAEEYYLKSIFYDIEDFCTDDPIYRILNLCRVFYYLKEKVVSSKDEAGVWTLEKLPSKYKNLVKNAVERYRGSQENAAWNKRELSGFYNYMVEQIKQAK